jgi:NAD(P)H-dependent flavin oxidoreductase YrpB (nitropropane dioxygenase family)
LDKIIIRKGKNMFKTKITEMLGIKHPIIGGTMMSISDANFVAAISNAGGLGVIASAIYKTKEEFAEAIDKTKELTDKPFAVNINLFPGMTVVDNDEYTNILIDKGIKIVESSGHSAPEKLCNRWKEAGMIWIHKCVGIKYALKVQSMGADIVTVVGYENGGATGKLDISTLTLIPSVANAIDLPVIGGGGVSDGRGFLALRALGAEGVIIGTRLMMTQEAPLHIKLKQALVDAKETDTMLVMRSIGATHRVWNNAAANRIIELEENKGDMMEIFSAAGGDNARKMLEEGDLDIGMISCGQGVGMAKDIPSVKELFDRIISEAAEISHKITPK